MVQWILLGAFASAGGAVFGAVLMWIIVPLVVDYMVKMNVILYEGSEQYERFTVMPQPLHFKVYLFNVTNADRTQNGELPIVREIGPYIYRQFRRKTIVEVNANKTLIKFREQQVFHFDAEASLPFSEDDKIVMLDIPMTSFLHIVDKGYRRTVKLVGHQLNDTLEMIPIVRTIKHILSNLMRSEKSMMQKIDEDMTAQLGLLNAHLGSVFGRSKSIFVQTTARRFLFDGIPMCENVRGLAEVICDMLKLQELRTLKSMPDGSVMFSLFNYKNGSDDGLFTMHSGVDAVLKIGQIVAWNDHVTLSTWAKAPASCNILKGTDATMFTPHLPANGSLFIYSTDICRTVEIYYEKEIWHKGIRGLRFVTGDNFLNQIGHAYSTQCFCTDTMSKIPKQVDGCLLRGAVDLTPCHGAPIILTRPHLVDVAPEYRTVKGLGPDINKHQTFVDIEPYTGYPLRGGKRVQFNMFVRKVDQIDVTQKLKTFLMPIAWVDEGIILNDAMIQMLNDKLFNILYIVNIALWTAMIGGVVLAVGLFFAFFYIHRKANKVYTFK